MTCDLIAAQHLSPCPLLVCSSDKNALDRAKPIFVTRADLRGGGSSNGVISGGDAGFGPSGAPSKDAF
jgi:hypothetical protein